MKRSAGVRLALASCLIASTAILLWARGSIETIVSRPPLSDFPAQLGEWTGKDEPLDEKTRRVLGPGDFLVRKYSGSEQKIGSPDIDLFIPYFPSQRTGDTIHSPKNCIPGSGWNPEENTRVILSLPGHAPFPANRYVVSRDGERMLVLYWYWAHNRGVASEYWAKFYLVKDAIEMNRSDGAMVRLSTAMFPGETAEAAQERLRPFTALVVPLLDIYIPR